MAVAVSRRRAALTHSLGRRVGGGSPTSAEEFGVQRCGTPLAAVALVQRRITGDACVEALLRAGFHIRSRSSGLAILVRKGSLVMIPDVEVIETDLLASVLRSAGLSWSELEIHLAHVPSRSGFFARPALGAAADSTVKRK